MVRKTKIEPEHKQMPKTTIEHYKTPINNQCQQRWLKKNNSKPSNHSTKINKRKTRKTKPKQGHKNTTQVKNGD